MLQSREAAVWVGGLDALEGGEDVAPAFVGQVCAGLGGFGVLLRGETTVLAGRPGAIGGGAGRSTTPFWISLLMVFSATR